MRTSAGSTLVAAAAIYVVALGWAMSNVSYDIWGAMVILPFVVMASVPLLKRVFAGDDAHLYPIAAAGLIAKVGGVAVRHWISFDAYGGVTDAASYHTVAKVAVADIREGRLPLSSAIPHGLGSTFMESLTTAIYMITGTSRLGGFLIFGTMAYWGVVLFVRAAMISVPGLAVRRYAGLAFFAPSVVYWSSSIGKEAWLYLCLGLTSYAASLLLARRKVLASLILAGVGAGGAALARPHLAALWIGALSVALVAALLSGGDPRGRGGRLTTLLTLVVASIGLFTVAAATLRYLNPDGDDQAGVAVTDRISQIFEETTRRSEQGGSSFTPVTISGPQDWPEAIVRTLTRPLLHEARSVFELMPAFEMTALLLVVVFGWRRLTNLPGLMMRTPYLVFAFVTLLMFGLAFTQIANLGILTRQRSLVMPLMLLFVCTPDHATSEAERIRALGERRRIREPDFELSHG